MLEYFTFMARFLKCMKKIKKIFSISKKKQSNNTNCQNLCLFAINLNLI